jgi:hypothetical protein
MLAQKLNQDINELEMQIVKQSQVTSNEKLSQLYLIYELFINQKKSEYRLDSFQMEEAMSSIKTMEVLDVLIQRYGHDWTELYEEVQGKLNMLLSQYLSQENLTHDLQ